MADIFGSREGFVAVVSGQSVIPGKIKLADFEPVAALIASADFTQRTNQQFQHSLDGAVFVYVFGDQMGDVIIEGRIFPAICPDTAGGLNEVFKYYSAKRASKTPDPVQVVIGNESIVGFLTSLRIRQMGLAAEDPSSLYQSFFLEIKALPKE
jgi:hypothetical protein